eukprot:1219450-Prymnesium_polylepis.1
MQPHGTALTIGMCGTDGGVGGGPAIMRCRVNPASSHYSAKAGWDPAETKCLVAGWDLGDTGVRVLEKTVITRARLMPNITIVEPGNGGHGPPTRGPVRVLYFNRLKAGVDP